MESSVEPRLEPELLPIPGGTPKHALEILEFIALQIPIEIEIQQLLEVVLAHDPTPSPCMRWRMQSRSKNRARDSVA
jgi:hypothetical protein